MDTPDPRHPRPGGLRIALVSDWCLPRMGGIELQLRDLAVQLQRRGHVPEIITPVEGPAELDGIQVHRLGAPRLPRAGIVYTAGAFRRIRELLTAGRYDVVHVHFGIIAPAAHGATFIARQLALPTVATFHSVLARFGPPLAVVRGLMGVADWPVQWSAVSSVVAGSMQPLTGSSPVALLPNGIDVSFWARDADDPRPTPHRLRAVSVMRLHRRKRPAALLRALEASGAAMHLEIIGDGPERAALGRQVARMGMGDRVTLSGWKSQAGVRAALHGADLFLLPSRLEAFGIAALEARVAGLPVIAMSQGGARDFLTHGRDALLATGDRQFAGYIAQVASDTALRRRLAEACLVPPAGVDWPEVVGRVEDAYRRAITS